MLKKLPFILFSLFAQLAFAQVYPPKPHKLVTDYTHTLLPADKKRLEKKLVAFADSTSTQIAVVIMKTVGDSDINAYGTELGHRWGIGQKDKNNGVLILVSLNDHKLAILTGFGLEKALPDAVAAKIRTEDINPHFKTGDYYGGLDAGTDDIINYTKGAFTADAPAPVADDDQQTDDSQQSSISPEAIVITIMVVLIVLILIFGKRRSNGSTKIIGSRGSAGTFWWYTWGNSGYDNSGGWNTFSNGNTGFVADSGGNDSSNGDNSNDDDDRNNNDSSDSGSSSDFGGGDFGGGGSDGSW